MKPRQLKEQEPRVESGAIQFGSDWPGVFIRGDNAEYFAMVLRSVLNSASYLELNPLNESGLRALEEKLSESRVF